MKKKTMILALSLVCVMAVGSISAYAAERGGKLEKRHWYLARERSAVTVIGTERAKAIALERTGQSAETVQMRTLKLTWEGGRRVYEVEFLTGDRVEYDLTLDARTGQVLELQQEIEDDWNRAAVKPAAPSAPKRQPEKKAGDAAFLGVEKAKTIALTRAGLSAGEVTFTKAKQDREDGAPVYEIEFYTAGGVEYEYTIDARTGAVLEEDRDLPDWDD